MGVIAVTSKKVVENVELMHPGILSAGRARMVVVAVHLPNLLFQQNTRTMNQLNGSLDGVLVNRAEIVANRDEKTGQLNDLMARYLHSMPCRDIYDFPPDTPRN